MKIFDCTLFTDEKLIFDLRLNILNDYVDKFVIVEANHFHSGEKRNYNFNIDDYKKFKDKIIYIKIDKLPHFNKEDLFSKRTKSIKIISHQRNKLLDGLVDANDNDFVIYSDCDEIPNLKNINFFNCKKITIFKQKLFYYKFNLELKTLPWYGSRGCKKKDLIDFEWLRQIKAKKYNLLRIDTMFKKDKYTNIDIVENGGWHFSQLKSPENIFKKLLNDEHHDEFEMSGINLKKITEMVDEGYILHNHFTDKKDINNKWSNQIKLEKIPLIEMPEYLYNHQEKYYEWIAK